MFYGPLSSVKNSKVLIRESPCTSWVYEKGKIKCSLCDSGYLPNDIGICVACPQAASCDLSSCSRAQAYFEKDTSLHATCSLTASCEIHPKCSIPQSEETSSGKNMAK